ncbi:MAG TPA: chemotaxis protein CheD [Polyangiaceae bacterium]
MSLFRTTATEAVNEQELPKVHLGVGEVYIAERPTLAWTVLGSCVAVILYVPSIQVSAICHAQLPAPNITGSTCRESCPNPCFRGAQTSSNLKFVTCCVDYMASRLMDMGVATRSIACAVIGGANMFPVVGSSGSVGDKNVEVARQVLAQHSLSLRYEDVGGTRGRTLSYHTGNGRLRLETPRDRKATQ